MSEWKKPAIEIDGSPSMSQQVVNEPKSTLLGASSEAEAAARQTMEAKQREFYEPHMEQQRGGPSGAAGSGAAASHNSQPPADSDANMAPPDPLTGKDPWCKDTQSERVLKKRKSEDEGASGDPMAAAGGDY